MTGLSGLMSLFGGGNNQGEGLTPEQAALAEYTKMQGMVKARFMGANFGMGPSTNTTQLATGAQLAGAEKGAQLSDINTQIANAQSGAFSTDLGTILGNAFGTQNTTGNTGGSTNTSGTA